MTKIGLPLAAVLVLSACGGATSGVSPTAVSSYQRATLSASNAVSTYQSATQSMTTPAECQAAVQQYAAQMTAAIQAMHQTSDSLDDHMRSMGQTVAADMTCGADVMAQHLQQHLGVACTSADLAQNQAVAAAHAQLMASDTDHLEMRAAGMASMVGSGGMMSGADMAADMNGMVDAGYTAADGRHMGWGEAMNGCALSNGTYQPTASSDGGTPTTPAGG